MRNKKTGFAVRALVMAVALFLLVPLTAEPVSATMVSSGNVEVTSVEVIRKNSKGNPYIYTGKITKGMSVDVVVNVVDTTGVAPIQDKVVLNTSSFSIKKQSDMKITNVSGSAPYTYTITFTGLTYTGVGETLGFNITYSGVATPMDYCKIILSQCTEYVEQPPDDNNSTTPPSGPDTFFILKDVWFGDGGGEPVYAGRPCTLTATILATNGASSVDNVTATFSLPQELTFAEGSSVVYIGAVSPGSSTAVTTVLLPAANIPEGSYSVSIDISGVSRQSGQLVSSPLMTVSVPVLQPERFEIFNTSLPTDLMAGIDNGMGYGSVTFVNQGRGGVSNVVFEIIGNGLRTEEGRQFVGNIGPGEQRSVDFNLLADMAGQIEATVLAVYENARGEEQVLDYPFTVMVTEEYFGEEWYEPEYYDPDIGGMKKGPPNWVWILAGAVAAAVVVTLLTRRRRKQKQMAEAALDIDDADDVDDVDDDGGDGVYDSVDSDDGVK